MKVTIESTTRVVNVNGVACRVWEGVTARGIAVVALIPRIAAQATETAALEEFEADLEERNAPTDAACQAFPLRMLI